MQKAHDDQKDFIHGNSMSLELLARSLFGEKHFGSVNYTDISYWKKFYLQSVEVIEASIFASVGAIDPQHRKDISALISDAKVNLIKASKKDSIHSVLIVFLFRLVFLLMGRSPYFDRGRKRNFGVFRTLTYSQTEEQLSWLLQGAVRNSAIEIGFEDPFEADMAFQHWAKANKRSLSDRSNYVEWVRTTFPEIYFKFSMS